MCETTLVLPLEMVTYSLENRHSAFRYVAQRLAMPFAHISASPTHLIASDGNPSLWRLAFSVLSIVCAKLVGHAGGNERADVAAQRGKLAYHTR